MVDIEKALLAAERSGALIRHKVELEPGEFDERRLWLRPEVDELIRSESIDVRQRAIIQAALKRFVTGGRFTIVTADCRHQAVASLGDIRELKGPPPPFIEVRFRPPKHDLRLFGRFVGKEALVLTTYGMKSHTERTGQKRLSVPEERKRCDAAFRLIKIDLDAIAQTIRECMAEPEANFI